MRKCLGRIIHRLLCFLFWSDRGLAESSVIDYQIIIQTIFLSLLAQLSVLVKAPLRVYYGNY